VLINFYAYVDDLIKIRCWIFQFLGISVLPFDVFSTVSFDMGCAQRYFSGLAFGRVGLALVKVDLL
jgi:hypothetical protein